MDNLVQRNFGKKFADVFKNYLHKPLVSSMQKQRGKRTKRKAPTYAMNVAVGNSSHNASKEFPEQTEVANSNFRNNHLSWNINQDNLKNKNEKVVISQNNTTQIQDKENTMREIRSRGADSLGMYIESELFLNEEGIPHNANAIKKLKKRELSQNEYGTKFLPHKIETDQQKKSSSQLEDSVESSVNSCIRKTGDQGTNPIYRGNESKVYARTHDVLTVPIPDTRRKIRRKSKRSERRSNRAVKSIEEIKAFAEKLVAKVNELQHYLTENDTGRPDRGKKRSATGAVQVSSTLSRATTEKRSKISERCVPSRNVSFICSQNLDSELVNTANRGKTKIKRKRVAKQKARSVGREQWKRRSAFGTPSVKPSTIERRDSKKAKRRRKWGRWTDWSSCSVTCGKGRQIRWRYCLHNCTIAETEMEEKACQLPACPPGKFLGIF
ncbi:hypothetical protein KM043_017202 [Ampulex compressa]|nr:hypothetical protein KM043_017202 [Ampulex compressa]